MSYTWLAQVKIAQGKYPAHSRPSYFKQDKALSVKIRSFFTQPFGIRLWVVPAPKGSMTGMFFSYDEQTKS